jgi:hypothetical protein
MEGWEGQVDVTGRSLPHHVSGEGVCLNWSTEFRRVLFCCAPPASHVDPAMRSQRCSSVFLPQVIQAAP